ncbi:NlpC/P60 family protein [Polymorphum gilvum]|uniref:Phage cell wall peptidase, NlpC/P60 family n=1 Tax=Polymorphum gilvum (strain LMG 25793 / CGMCC 1.9160 / SL003B-26A1) TaxID=991905 RepID=F2J6G9_POLGS|nr:NlpC/P60 family protein [Polymorphum gilvum]ADZ71343.1 Phage cell wall peptidase, NlpC/P60 family [Polymorphum gilvum SL003B-26A1]
MFPEPAPIDRAALIAEARTWIGTPYRHQASAKGAGCDCLGLVRGLWRAFCGAEPEPLPAYGADWAETGGGEAFAAAGRRWLVEIDPGRAAPGDVLLLRWKDGAPAKHAGLLATASTLVHAYERVGVVESPLVPAWRRRIAHVFAFPGARPWQP